MENTFNQGNLPLNGEVSASDHINDMRANKANTTTVDYSTLTCLVCNKVFAHKSSLSRHASTGHSTPAHTCTRCGKNSLVQINYLNT